MQYHAKTLTAYIFQYSTRGEVAQILTGSLHDYPHEFIPIQAEETVSEYVRNTLERRGGFHLCVRVGLDPTLIDVYSVTRRQCQDSAFVLHECVPFQPAVPIFCGRTLLIAILVRESLTSHRGARRQTPVFRHLDVAGLPSRGWS
jgi:PHP family Zn ribbon phosphoesterase